jgi:hypothetical protein
MPRRKTTIDRNPLAALPRESASNGTSGPRLVQLEEPDKAVSGQQDGVLLATIEAQDAALAAGLSVLEATLALNRAALVAWSDVCMQAQRIPLAALGRPTMR